MIRVFRLEEDEVRIFAGETEVRIVLSFNGTAPVVQELRLAPPEERMKTLMERGRARQMFAPSEEEIVSI